MTTPLPPDILNSIFEVQRSKFKLFPMSSTRYLLIDAYNVICATPQLHEALRRNMDSARDMLADQVMAIHDAEGYRVALVLDSGNDRLEVEHPFGKKTFEYLYAPAGLSADGVIERIVARADKDDQVTVVSNDLMVRESIQANGADAMRPEELFDWARSCEQRLLQDAARRRKQNAQVWRNGIDLNLDL
ncbi:MAG: putative RNA-binding protein with PIN domain [Lentimonas sp.]